MTSSVAIQPSNLDKALSTIGKYSDKVHEVVNQWIYDLFHINDKTSMIVAFDNDQPGASNDGNIDTAAKDIATKNKNEAAAKKAAEQARLKGNGLDPKDR